MIGGGNNQNGSPFQTWTPPPRKDSSWSKWGGASPGLFSKNEQQTKRAPISVFPSASQNVAHLLQRPSPEVTSKRPSSSPKSVNFPKSFDQSIMKNVVKPYFDAQHNAVQRLQENSNLSVSDINQTLIDDIFDPGIYQQKLLDKKKVVLIYINSLQRNIKRFDSASFFKKQEERIRQKMENQESKSAIYEKNLGSDIQSHNNKAESNFNNKNSALVQTKNELAIKDLQPSIHKQIRGTIETNPNEIPKITSFFNKIDSYITGVEEDNKFNLTIHTPAITVHIPTPPNNLSTTSIEAKTFTETSAIYQLSENKKTEPERTSVWSTISLTDPKDFQFKPSKSQYNVPGGSQPEKEEDEEKKEDNADKNSSLKRFGTQSAVSKEERERIKRERKRLNNIQYRAEMREKAAKQREEMRSIPFSSILKVVQNITSKVSKDENDINEASSQPTAAPLPKPPIEEPKQGMNLNALIDTAAPRSEESNNKVKEKKIIKEKSCEQPFSTMALTDAQFSNSNKPMPTSRSSDNLKVESKGPQLKQLRAIIESSARQAKDSSFISTRIRDDPVDLSQITKSDNESEKEPKMTHSPSAQILQSRPSIVKQLERIKIEATGPAAGIFPKPDKELAKVPLFFRREEPEPKQESKVPKFFDSELSGLKESDIQLKRKRNTQKRSPKSMRKAEKEASAGIFSGRSEKKNEESDDIHLSEDEPPKKKTKVAQYSKGDKNDREVEKKISPRRGRRKSIEEEKPLEMEETVPQKIKEEKPKAMKTRRGRKRISDEEEKGENFENGKNISNPKRRREKTHIIDETEDEEIPKKRRKRKQKCQLRPVKIEHVGSQLLITLRPPSLFVHVGETADQKEASSLVNRQSTLEDFGINYDNVQDFIYGGEQKPLFEPEDPNDL